MIGQILDHYRIESKLGEGGMGVVYKARDTHLDRAVAIKVLPPDKLADPSRKQRFVQEAKAASALNHPNIVTIHDVRHWNETEFIVMEYVDGRTLDELIPPKGMRPPQALRYAVQIADAMAKAHGAGILHRDLKPSNIMVTGEGRVKILDFGLAKLLEPEEPSPDTPTRTMQELTEEGALVGTAAYMSPEQAEGLKLDGRSDIFSLGSVLYQMVTGRRPFAADSRLSLLNRIVNEEPAPPSQSAAIPSELEKLILRCLRKDVSRRYQTMADLRVALEDLEMESSGPQGPTSVATASGVGASARPRMRRFVPAALAIAVAAAIAMMVFRAVRRPSADATLRTVKFTFTPNKLGRGAENNTDAEVNISPDGKHITFVESDGGQLWVRDIDQEKARPVAGATRVYQVFWSPDSQFIGYAAGLELSRIALQGGTPTLITKLAGQFRRAFWSSDGETIVYCDATGLYTIPARGGAATRVIEHKHIEHPSFLDLPDKRRAYLFQALDPPPKGSAPAGPPRHGIYVQVVGEEARRLITQSASINPYPAYSPSGHIIYVDGQGDSSAIWALPFSLATLKAEGKAFPIAQRGSSPQVSRNGTLVYSDVPSDRVQLAWWDRSGKRLSSIGEPQVQHGPTLSPDGRRMAVTIRDGDVDIWIYDLERGIKTRFTFDPEIEDMGVWTPLGDEITYTLNRGANVDIFSKPSSGSGEAKRLVDTPGWRRAPDWSPDHRFLIYESPSPETKRDLVYRERHQDGTLGEEAVFQRTPFDESGARFSPDGRYVVYQSDESGRYEIYVRSFPSGNKWQVSAHGGVAPRWRRDGKEIFYIEGRKLMAVPVAAHPVLAPGAPAALFELPMVLGAALEYDAAADGKRFIVRERPENEPPLAIHVVHNWFEEFRGRPQI
jgi:eukaryotic-like serine/threonine-protein kinase